MNREGLLAYIAAMVVIALMISGKASLETAETVSADLDPDIELPRVHLLVEHDPDNDGRVQDGTDLLGSSYNRRPRYHR